MESIRSFCEFSTEFSTNTRRTESECKVSLNACRRVPAGSRVRSSGQLVGHLCSALHRTKRNESGGRRAHAEHVRGSRRRRRAHNALRRASSRGALVRRDCTTPARARRGNPRLSSRFSCLSLSRARSSLCGGGDQSPLPLTVLQSSTEAAD